MRNASLKFVCRDVKLKVDNAKTAFTRGYAPGQIIRCPVAHHDGNYFADAETLAGWKAKARSSSAMPKAPIPTARSATSPASSTNAATCSA